MVSYHENSKLYLYSTRFKARSGKKKTTPGKDEWSVVGYSAANSFDMFGLQEGLQRQLIYSEISLIDELYGNCLYVTNKYKSDLEEQNKEIFFFKDGNVVFWNVPELERNNVLKFLMNYSVEGYEEDLIYEESEMMNYTPTLNENAYLEKGIIYVNPDSPSYVLAKYTFSDAIAASVKLGAWEASLETIIDSIEHISEDLKKNANVKMTRHEVLQKTGEILALRHVINLSSDLLDTPDFYWDREGLENLYMATCSHLAVAKRTKIVNEKLSHCLELMELISTHLSNEHGSRLEWIIIVLIAIEIGFEVLHLVERKYGGFSFFGSQSDH
ncbi:required for meiotic nuclear division protein 1 homolog [Eurytemora carolleeae]|uniref:required for meiotic nuclear division protein 1 homolog n=1 Tax=Eurytemora carolleeae TaxID=1294199 RepID=UPI000C79402A|nr:required for meiotic nuclear division protein 1 homolog [Eurytemora carolleeae]|eukprot:XP_023342438.1 required for meiotic nuclear division protein 1 homolog [Eurytemora affinis]